MIELKTKSARAIMSLSMGAILLLSVPLSVAQADQRHWAKSSDNRYERSERKKTVTIHKTTRKSHKRSHTKIVKTVTYYPTHTRNKKPHRWNKGHGRRVQKHRYYEHQAVYYPKPTYQNHRQQRNSNFNLDGVLGGRIIGAILGGAAGTQFGKGRGRTVAIIGAAIIGSVIGGEVGKSMQQSDQDQAQQVLESAPTGNTIQWNNPDTGHQYEMTPTKTYRSSSNQACRDYTTWVFVDGFEEQVKGRACRMSDGRWKMLS